MVRPMFFSAYATCWYEFLILGPVHLFSHFQTSLLILLITLSPVWIHTLPTDVLKVRLSRRLNKTFWPGVFKQPTNSPAPASYPAPIELPASAKHFAETSVLMPNWYGTHSEKLNTQSAYCQVKKLIFVNPCGEKTYILLYFALHAGGKHVQVYK